MEKLPMWKANAIKEKHSQRMKKWYSKNRERVNDKQKKYYWTAQRISYLNAFERAFRSTWMAKELEEDDIEELMKRAAQEMAKL